MAKRKRLTLPEAVAYTVAEMPIRDGFAPETKNAFGLGLAPPIAQVAGDAAVRAALDEVSLELASARAEGRLVLRVPLEAVDAAWIARDRIRPGDEDDDEMAALIESLRIHGQRTPIELSPLRDGQYGLISGWRRLTALSHLHTKTGDKRFATVLAFLRTPDTAAEAYVAMVEENEIRLGLSNFERARIVSKAVEAGAFSTKKEALNSLFGSVSRAKRSKIGSFLTIYHALDGVLLYPNHLGERLGLVLARELEALPDLAAHLIAALEAEAPATPEQELALIQRILMVEKGSDTPVSDIFSAPPPPSAAPAAPPSPMQEPTVPQRAEAVPHEIAPGLAWVDRGAELHLSGSALTPEMRSRLRQWLLARVTETRR